MERVAARRPWNCSPLSGRLGECSPGLPARLCANCIFPPEGGVCRGSWKGWMGPLFWRRLLGPVLLKQYCRRLPSIHKKHIRWMSLHCIEYKCPSNKTTGSASGFDSALNCLPCLWTTLVFPMHCVIIWYCCSPNGGETRHSAYEEVQGCVNTSPGVGCPAWRPPAKLNSSPESMRMNNFPFPLPVSPRSGHVSPGPSGSALD